MSTYLGDFRINDTVIHDFNTRDATGAAITFAGSPAVLVYKNSTTESSSTGITLTVDYDSRTGLHHLVIDMSANSSFFTTATDFSAVITSGTVNGISVVGTVVARWSVENRSALMPTTKARTLVVDASGLADANAVKVGPTGSGTAQTAGDIYGKVQQLNFTVSGEVNANARYINGVSAGSVTTINANMGTTQPVNFTGTGPSALVKGDAPTAAAVRVEMDTNSTQLAALIVGVNVSKILGATPDLSTSNRLLVSVASFTDLAGNAEYQMRHTGAGTTVTFASGVVARQGDQMDLINAPNATAVTAIQSGLQTTITVDGKTASQALQIIGAMVAGKISGAGTGTEVFLGLDGLTTRVTVTVDISGNRTAVVYA